MKLSDRLAEILCNPAVRKPRLGICGHENVVVDDLSAGIKAWLAARGTPHVSTTTGDRGRSWVFPVGGEHGEARGKYTEASMKGTMWRGEYGQERKALLRFLIRYYRERGL